MHDFGKAVLEPEIECAWSQERRGGLEGQTGEQRGDVVPLRVLLVEAPGWGLQERNGENDCEGGVIRTSQREGGVQGG